MVRQLTDVLLHKKTKHTNYTTPFSEFISSDKFPKQDKNKLNTYINLSYRNMYIVEDRDEEGHLIITEEFLIVRYDVSEPFRLIGISRNFSVILIGDTRNYQDTIIQYPIQLNEFCILSVFDQYPAHIPEIKGVTLRVDEGEPCNSVIIEFLADNYVRFLIGDECFTKLFDYYDHDGSRDFDGKDSTEYENPIDLDGYYPDWSNIKEYLNIDGGPADCLIHMYYEVKTVDEINEMRKLVLEGKKIYESD